MAYTISVSTVEPQWLASVRGPMQKNVSSAMLALLTTAWDLVKKNGIRTDGINVAIYTASTIEAGPRVMQPSDGTGSTPSGLAASTTHMGSYELLGQAHRAVREWCASNGHQTEGTNWEVYGHHEEDPSRRRTDVFYLLRS
jgi:effector-binding domain-containing protein